MGRLEYWNISWWVAQTFTWGSVIWCINGFAAFLPFCNSHVEPSLDLTGWTAFIGATIFEVGSVLGVLEALNRRDAVVFSDEATGKTADDNSHEHEPPRSPTEKGTAQTDQSPRRKKWVWLPTNAKYWHEMGFLAAFFQLLGATIFWISGFTALPSILTVLSKSQGHLDGAFWTPQVVGGTGFIISSIFIMLEEQRIWWQPRLVSLGWQIGVWNFIGAIGFTLCGALGYSTNSGAQYESSLATFWGSWAFLIASVLQWYECVNAV
ncbi:hypothetical protein CPB84DRAFT_1769501 [Gymnopilus junonius]|uniref:Integral membrane protein n=1 Tax=Gymnopilus junonius TaxID=109634 RepID=A0A9P5NU14_GYMJU|nr:hypothetical protein CPB84DRAFT_1769501 [Gymnopilus junonius]